jgi:hypothetical protein
MVYKVRVKDSALLCGHARDRVRLNILPGTYDVEKTGDDDLVFHCADTRDTGDLVVRKGEYLELDDLPNIGQNPYIEIIE